MKRALVAALALVLPVAAWASGLGIVNRFGTVSISNAGIISKGSQLTTFEGIVAPSGHALGSVSFSTGALTSGSFFTGGRFSSVGSSFVVIGKGNFGQPKGVIFTGTFVGQIKWTLLSTNGANLVFQLSGQLNGTIYNGRVVVAQTKQTIITTTGQLAKGIGHIAGGTTRTVLPEPGTFGLLGTGLAGIAGLVLLRLWAGFVLRAPNRRPVP